MQYVTCVTDSDIEVVDRIFPSPQQVQCTNCSRRFVDGEGFGGGGWILGQDGVSQNRIQCPFFIAIMSQQLSYEAT